MTGRISQFHLNTTDNRHTQDFRHLVQLQIKKIEAIRKYWELHKIKNYTRKEKQVIFGVCFHLYQNEKLSPQRHQITSNKSKLQYFKNPLHEQITLFKLNEK
jgi:hypothetical protein